MSDLRQGVTPAANEVLDMVELIRRAGGTPSGRLLMRASENLVHAQRGVPIGRRSAAVTAAALVIAAIEQLDKELET